MRTHRRVKMRVVFRKWQSPQHCPSPGSGPALPSSCHFPLSFFCRQNWEGREVGTQMDAPPPNLAIPFYVEGRVAPWGPCRRQEWVWSFLSRGGTRSNSPPSSRTSPRMIQKTIFLCPECPMGTEGVISLTTRNPTSLKKVHWRKEPLPQVPLGTAGAGLALTLTPALPLPFPLKHICPAQAQSLQVEAGLTDQEQAQPLLSVGTARDITTSPMLGPCQLPQGEEESARQPERRLPGGVQGRQSPAPRWD